MNFRDESFRRLIQDKEALKYELQNQPKSEFLALFINEMEIFKERRILDFLCGTGMYSVFLAQINNRVIVTETCPEAIQITTLRAKQNEISLEFAQISESFEVSLPKNVFNGATMIDSINYFNDSEVTAIIKELNRLLIKNGFLFINFLPEEPIPTKFKFEFKSDGTFILHEGPDEGKVLYLRDSKKIEAFFKEGFALVDIEETKSGMKKVLAKKI
ncbi:class I SAM-dependent methyltransferase [candidate division WOR-3 bacterium]|nr:class I SAM-dependent methyltransferase [candidate division WOR-3 bacterium]